MQLLSFVSPVYKRATMLFPGLFILFISEQHVQFVHAVLCLNPCLTMRDPADRSQRVEELETQLREAKINHKALSKKVHQALVDW